MILFDHLLESSRDCSNKWSNIGFDEEIMTQVEFVEDYFTRRIQIPALVSTTVKRENQIHVLV